MIEGKIDKKKMLKSKIIAKVHFNLEFLNMDWDEARNSVKQELVNDVGINKEKADNVVELVIAEFIQNNK